MDELGYGEQLSSLASLCSSERGQAHCLDLTPFKEVGDLREELSNSNLALGLFLQGGFTGPTESLDLRPYFKGFHKGLVLDGGFASNFLGDCRYFYPFREKLKEAEPSSLLATRLSYVSDLRILEKACERTFDEGGKVRDAASSTLSGIRKALGNLGSALLSSARDAALKYQGYLSAKEPLYRDGRYVLSVLKSYKNNVDGLIVGYSGSGETAYVLPRSLLELENEMSRLKDEESREVAKILRTLTARFLEEEGEVLYLNETVAYLDFLFAKARYAVNEGGVYPELSENTLIDLRGLRQPCIKREKAVENDFHLDEEDRLLAISGPNAGGKSVALKAVGLAALAFSSGLPVLCKEGSRLSYFPNVLFDIGDHQDIGAGLSTFSAHMKAVGQILKEANKGDLVLLDEPGTGTAPREGEAIAKAIASALLNKGVLAVLTSHYEGLKEFAGSSKGAKNAAMGYKGKSYEPSYHLEYGARGQSFSLEAAVRFGLPQAVAEQASVYLGEGPEADLARREKMLEVALEAAKKKEAEAEAALRENQAKEEELSKRENVLLKEEAEAKQKAKTAMEAALEKAEEEIAAILKDINSSSKPHELLLAKKKLEGLRPAEEENKVAHVFKVGDYARVPSLGIRGRIAEIKGKKADLRSKDGFSYQVPLEDLELAEGEGPKKREVSVSYVRDLDKPAVKLELNLIGMHYEEALEALASYLDSARLAHFKRVRIIHGLGSGVLKKMVSDYLSKHGEFVASYESAGAAEGGLGATIVHLR